VRAFLAAHPPHAIPTGPTPAGPPP
jgi:hypothetical protein